MKHYGENGNYAWIYRESLERRIQELTDLEDKFHQVLWELRDKLEAVKEETAEQMDILRNLKHVNELNGKKKEAAREALRSKRGA